MLIPESKVSIDDHQHGLGLRHSLDVRLTSVLFHFDFSRCMYSYWNLQQFQPPKHGKNKRQGSLPLTVASLSPFPDLSVLCFFLVVAWFPCSIF
jgi:hypothetical protein